MMANKPIPPKTNVYEAYKQWSQTYDSQQNPTRDLSQRVLQHLVPQLDGLTVIEAGCGTGFNSQWLAPHCQQLIGLDFSDNMLAIARRKVPHPHVQFMKHNITHQWPVPPNSADLILINLVLEHIEIIEPVLRHAATVMRSQANLIITEYHPDLVAAGLGARIQEDKESEASVHILNYWHPITEYAQIADNVGLDLVSTNEWLETALTDAPQAEAKPLLLSVQMKKRLT